MMKSLLRFRQKRLLEGAALSVLLTLGGLGVAVSLEACGGSDSTSGKRVVLHTRVELDSQGSAFTTAFGWNVTLTQIAISGGELYYFDGVPPLAQSEALPRDFRFAQRWLGLSVANAHPGHYVAGTTLGQMLEPWSVDLLAGTATLPDGDGVTGSYRSASFSFHTPKAGNAVAALGSHVAVVAGRAEMMGAEPRFFLASADSAEIAKSVKDAQVLGCEFEEIEVKGNGSVTLSVLPQVWFDLVDFNEVEPGASDAPSTFAADSQPQIAFSQGLAELSAYKFVYQPD